MQEIILYDNKVIELETPTCSIGTPLVISLSNNWILSWINFLENLSSEFVF